MRGNQDDFDRDILPDANLPRPSTGLIIVGILALVGVGMLWSLFYTVETDEVAVVQRFGKYVRREEPGLRFKLPVGIETVHKVKVKRQLTEEFGFRTEKAGVQSKFSPRTFPDESLMLTGDLNVADVEWSVQYRIADPVQYLFGNRDSALALKDTAQIAMRSVIGDYTVSEVLTERRTEIADLARTRMQELLERYNTGLRVDLIQMRNVTPPSEDVKRAFNEVNEAQQERERKINEAQQAYNQEIPRERGEVERTLAKAEGYAINRTNTAKGDVSRFNALLAEYRKAPEVTRRRLYLETMRDMLPGLKQLFIFDADQQLPLFPFLDLQRGANEVAPTERKEK